MDPGAGIVRYKLPRYNPPSMPPPPADEIEAQRGDKVSESTPPTNASSGGDPLATITQSHGEHYNATVSYWEDVNDELAIFRIEPDQGPVPAFEAGQFATLGLPRNHPPVAGADDDSPDDRRSEKLWRRAYSIASSPHERRYLEFYAVVVEGGEFTPKLWLNKVGSRLWLDPKIEGDFTLKGVPEGRDLVTVSTGTGLAPYLSMYKSFRDTGRWRRFVIVHGVRRAADLGYRAELETLAAEDRSLVYIPCVSREAEDSPFSGIRGRVTAVLEDEAAYARLAGAPLRSDDAHVFLCGNPDMIDQVETIMHRRGFVTQTPKSPGNLHFERYW